MPEGAYRIPDNIPKKLYGACIIDPPWDVFQRGRKNNRSAERHYNLLTLEEIAALPVPELMKESSVIHLWCTNATIRYGYQILEKWGYRPVSILCWFKEANGALPLGNFYRNQTEHVLVGVRGNPDVKFHGQPNTLFAPRQPHSWKPEEYHQIVRRMSDGPYLELFARRPYPGFDVWGNEVISDVYLPGYPVREYSFEQNHNKPNDATGKEAT